MGLIDVVQRSYHYITGGPQDAKAAFNLLNFELKGGTQAKIDGFIVQKNTEMDGDAKITVWDAQTRAPLFQFRKLNHLFWDSDYIAYQVSSYDNDKVSLRTFTPESKLGDGVMFDNTLEQYAQLFKLGALRVFCADDDDRVCDGSHHRSEEIDGVFTINIDPQAISFK